MYKTGGKGAGLSKNRKAVLRFLSLYFFFLAGLVILYGTYIPCLMDYYIVRPEESYFTFFYENHCGATYTFEGILVGMAFAALYCLTMQAGVSMVILSGLLFLLTHASYIKFVNRKELLRLDDLRLTEAAGMAVGYLKFTPDRFLAILAGGLLLFVAAGVVLDCLGDKGWKAKSYRRENVREQQDSGEKSVLERGRARRLGLYAIRLLGCAGLCVCICLYTNHFFGERYVIDVIEPISPEKDRYVLYRFLQNDSLSMISVEQAEESYDFLLSQSPPRQSPVTGGVPGASENAAIKESSGYPNIIVIMNESWWNTDNIQSNRITFSQDPMGPYKELADRCSTGWLTSPVCGGGTLRPEIEFLTGLNTKYYNTDAVYAKLQGRRVSSVADYFNGLGYETVAIHPYYDYFYGREGAYAGMGFDRVIFEGDMQHKDIYTRYISDESLAKEIIALSRQEGDAPKFIWAVSIANHSRVLDYHEESVTDYDYPIEMSVAGERLGEEDYGSVVNYINGIYLANLAFAQLVEYFSMSEQPTVLMMFGDHCPYFSAETLEAFGLGERADGAKERLYTTPVIVWSNGSEEKPDFTGESMYYLPMMLIDYAGLPDSDMTRILRYERLYFQTNSWKFVRDASGELIREGTEEQIRALSHYKTVQYDILEGDGLGEDVWKPIISKRWE